ncbi:elongation of very long chain fatty acids protein-like [Frankliniella occidentalis]|uniref:Elongation of very long chain fatty acids protein n=1 Tax=Frankliniella occidentalis TaxID=133901 RepID=A0A6J1SLV5_FRAOC|nr:elongation of very long chain fatty acids protein-like [Frankliniella occidentalis]XP_052133080.1 elongation of very long chain fatty acids protein-like [Frankliniella occidentalis]
MSQILSYTTDVLIHYGTGFWSYTDPRSEHLPMMKTPLPVLAIVAGYLYFALSLGPRLMRHREPFKLDKAMLVYNAVQVLWCAYLIKECFRLGWGSTYSWLCEPLSKTSLPSDYEAAHTVWLYFILKIVDLLDTAFMVLRKNFRQISFLHVYHHTAMVIAMWIAVKLCPGGHHTFLGFQNCIVHCLLYGYYFVSLVEPRVKSAWWKKYITLIQMVQFGVNVVHELSPFLIPGCDVDRRIGAAIIAQNICMLAFFGEFYHKNYYTKQGRNKDN